MKTIINHKWCVFFLSFCLSEKSEILQTTFKRTLGQKVQIISDVLTDEDMGLTSAGGWQPAPSRTPALPPGTRTPEAPDPPSSARPRWRADPPGHCARCLPVSPNKSCERPMGYLSINLSMDAFTQDSMRYPTEYVIVIAMTSPLCLSENLSQ